MIQLAEEGGALTTPAPPPPSSGDPSSWGCWAWAGRRMASQALHAHCPSCSLALSSLNKHTEAVAYYRKALELDPDNETYKSNLKVAELRLREAPSPVSPLGTGRGGRAARGRGLGLTRVGGTSLVPGVRHLFNGVLS